MQIVDRFGAFPAWVHRKLQDGDITLEPRQDEQIEPKLIEYNIQGLTEHTRFSGSLICLVPYFLFFAVLHLRI